MPRGSKAKYSDKQKRQARHIEKSMERRGYGEKDAAGRAWAVVNKISGGGKKSGSGVGKKTNKKPMKKGGKLGGKAAASRPKSARSASAKKGARTRSAKSGRKTTARTTRGRKTTSRRR